MSTRQWYEKILEPEYAITTAYLFFFISVYLSFKISATKRHLIASFSTSPTIEAYLLSLIGIGVLFYSIRLGRRIEFQFNKVLLASIFIITSLVVYLTLEIHPLLALFAGGGYVTLLYYLSAQNDLRNLTKLVFILALISALSILIRGIPILSASAREVTAVSTSRALFHGFGVFAAVLFMGFYNRKQAAAAVTLLAVAGLLSGFKSDAIAIIISASLTGLLLKRISIKTAGLSVVAVGLILTGVSTFIALVSYGSWDIPPYLYPLYRFGFTFSVFSRITEIALPFGALKGQAILSTTQEIVSTAVLGYGKPHIITSTLFGPLTLDFGVLGTIATAFFLGLYLGVMKIDTILRTCLYAMALTHILVLIEVGLQLSSMMFLLSMLYLSARSSNRS